MRSPTFAKFSTGYIYSLWETKKLCSNIWIWEWNMSDCRMAQSAMLVFSEWVICRAVNGASRNLTVPGKGPYCWKCKPTSNFTIKNLLRQQRSEAACQWQACLNAEISHFTLTALVSAWFVHLSRQLQFLCVAHSTILQSGSSKCF